MTENNTTYNAATRFAKLEEIIKECANKRMSARECKTECVTYVHNLKLDTEGMSLLCGYSDEQLKGENKAIAQLINYVLAYYLCIAGFNTDYDKMMKKEK